MLKAKVKDGRVSGLNVSGDLATVAADIGVLIEAIYDMTFRANPGAAAEFKAMIQWGAADGSPVWSRKGTLVSGGMTVATFGAKERSNGNGNV